jgi:hypothetical protein
VPQPKPAPKPDLDRQARLRLVYLRLAEALRRSALRLRLDGWVATANSQPRLVRIQIRKRRGWCTVKKVVTDEVGRFAVRLRKGLARRYAVRASVRGIGASSGHRVPKR